MKKKILSVALIFAMLFGTMFVLTGCAENGGIISVKKEVRRRRKL